MTAETPAAPIVIAEFQKNQRETVRVTLTEYQGNQLVDIRAYYPSTDGLKPGKGISLQRSLITELRKALQTAERTLKADESAPVSRRRKVASKSGAID